jgi:hypothetical protein
LKSEQLTARPDVKAKPLTKVQTYTLVRREDGDWQVAAFQQLDVGVRLRKDRSRVSGIARHAADRETTQRGNGCQVAISGP